ncbi:MAG: hypothetical protein RIF41_34075, partial [Polyangiaceae bacterium]
MSDETRDEPKSPADGGADGGAEGDGGEPRLTEDPVERDRPSHVETPAGRGRQLVAAALGVVALGGVIMIAVHRAKPPARCPDGLVAMSSRCCGEGQALEDGRCAGTPTRCSEELQIAQEGCVPENARIAVSGGKLELIPYDWEAAQQGV